MFAEKEDWCSKLCSTELLRLRLRSPSPTPTPTGSPVPIRYRTIVLYLGKPGVQAAANALVHWCVWAKYRTIVPNLGTPGERAAASRQLGSSAERTIAEICQFDLELPACWAGHPERTIIRLPGCPRLKNEQSFGCPDFPACSTNKKTRARSSGFCPKFYLLSR